jgi:hypothetical protein
MLHHILTISFGLLAAALVGHALLCSAGARAAFLFHHASAAGGL